MPNDDKEKEIIERQRRLAAQIKPAKSAPSASAVVTLKRPTKKTTVTNIQSSAALLQAARSKASKKTSSSSSQPPKASPKLVRKSVTTSTTSQLVQQAAKSSNVDSDAVPLLADIQPEFFWKNLRDWDFLKQYAQTTDDSATTTNNTKPLPNVFLSSRHYIAAWAPLCLAECRAQLIQEFTQSTTIQPILVTVNPTNPKAKHLETDDWLQENETACHVVLRPKNNSQGSNLTFMINDICILLSYEQALTDAKCKGAADDSSSTSFAADCIVGHAQGQRTLHGLILKISKKKYVKYAKKEMWFVKIGSNVTALREFTALCGVETLKVKRYLLGQHLEEEQNRRKLSRHQSTKQLLEQMGGKQALGPGFVEYAQRKFNPSQLTAIAASANEYGEGGFTLIKGPPGTGKTTTLVAVLNSLHIRQYNKYYEEVRRIAALPTGARSNALELARRAKPRLLVCAPSNAAVDNIILKIMQDGFVDGQGQRYNPSMIRIGVGQSSNVRAVSLETKVDSIFGEHDVTKLDASITGYRVELSRITRDIAHLRRRTTAISKASPWPLSKNWEIRIDEESFDTTGRVYFVNHREKRTTYEVPPPPEPGEAQYPAHSMPEYRTYMSRIVKLVENYFSIKEHLELATLVKGSLERGANQFDIRQSMENHVLNSVHMVMTTLGTAGSRTLEQVDKFEVVVVDEAAQSVEPATLSALGLGSRHAVLVGDPQQLPATIFNVSGRNSKYDRSLFQRLEEAGQPVYMLNEQYRMHPQISHFPRHIFYGGGLLDGPNVQKSDYGDPLLAIVRQKTPNLQPLTILDLDSRESKAGTSLQNFGEAKLAVHLYLQLKEISGGVSSSSRVAVITPYSFQSKLLKQMFKEALGPRYEESVEVNTVDAFQGREANIVIFSAVRAAGSHGIGFLSDVRRMNVALTRAKHFLFVIARCKSIVVNPYWDDLVQHARETNAVVRVPTTGSGNTLSFGTIASWALELPRGEAKMPPAVGTAEPMQVDAKPPPPTKTTAATQQIDLATANAARLEEKLAEEEDGEVRVIERPKDPRKKPPPPPPPGAPPPKPSDPRNKRKRDEAAV